MVISLDNIHLFSAFWLILSKWLAAIVQLPHFNESAIPMRVKILFSLVVSIAFSPVLLPIVQEDLLYVGVENFWFLQIFYLITGLLIGYGVKTIINIFQAAGAVISLQVGFSAASYFDPTTSSRSDPLEKLIRWTILVMVICSPSLAPMFKGLLTSFTTASLKNFGMNLFNIETVFSFFKGIILSAITLALPIIVTNTFINALLGVISRLVPQLNIIMISFVVNIAVGLFVFIGISTEFFEKAIYIYAEYLGIWFKMIKV